MDYIDTFDRSIYPKTYEKIYQNQNGKTIRVIGYNNQPSEKALRNYANTIINIAQKYIEGK